MVDASFEPRQPDGGAPGADSELLMRAKVAGLEAVMQSHPDDVRIALNDALRFLSELAAEFAPTDEPWPSMRAMERR